jgi:hypothetical protein
MMSGMIWRRWSFWSGQYKYRTDLNRRIFSRRPRLYQSCSAIEEEEAYSEWFLFPCRRAEKSHFYVCCSLLALTYRTLISLDEIWSERARGPGRLTDGRQDKIRGSQRLIYLRTGPSVSVLRRRIWVHLSCQACQLVPRS